MVGVTITQEGNRACFSLSGKIDERGAEELKSRFMELNKSNLAEIVFDFEAVSHIGSAGIGKLLLFYKDMAVVGGIIRVVNVSDNVFELFGMLKLNNIFDISKK